MFSKPLLTRRCVIPSTGFYEWALVTEREQMSLFDEAKTRSSKKIKLYFRLPDEPMLYMAGIRNTFADANGNPRDSFCILTTNAAHTIARFHERMPVILKKNECEDWIRSDAFMQEVLARKNRPDLECKRVSP
jgi:putative SOS response-associated peptidase YedK